MRWGTAEGERRPGGARLSAAAWARGFAPRSRLSSPSPNAVGDPGVLGALLGPRRICAVPSGAGRGVQAAPAGETEAGAGDRAPGTPLQPGPPARGGGGERCSSCCPMPGCCPPAWGASGAGGQAQGPAPSPVGSSCPTDSLPGAPRGALAPLQRDTTAGGAAAPGPGQPGSRSGLGAGSGPRGRWGRGWSHCAAPAARGGQELPPCLSFPLIRQWGLRERRPGAGSWS